MVLPSCLLLFCVEISVFFFRALCGGRANVFQPVQLIPPHVPRVAVLITRQMEGPAKEWGRSGGGAGGGEWKKGEVCDVFINKKQLCMMLTAGWSAPRPNPALLLLTFQRSGAYPRQCAQSSLSRSGSVQGSGGGRPWLSLLPGPQKHTQTAKAEQAFTGPA